MTPIQQPRPNLTLISAAAVEPIQWGWFCGHCAATAPVSTPPDPSSRVCMSCGLGLLLETHRGAIPAPDEAFLVVDAGLSIQGMSRRAQLLLSVCEEEAVNRPVAELLVPADAEAQATTRFAAAIVDAAAGGGELGSGYVRPWNTFGVRMRARVAPCGPPRAALVILEERQGRHLRPVC